MSIAQVKLRGQSVGSPENSTIHARKAFPCLHLGGDALMPHFSGQGPHCRSRHLHAVTPCETLCVFHSNTQSPLVSRADHPAPSGFPLLSLLSDRIYFCVSLSCPTTDFAGNLSEELMFFGLSKRNIVTLCLTHWRNRPFCSRKQKNQCRMQTSQSCPFGHPWFKKVLWT